MQAGWKKTHWILGLYLPQDQTVGRLCSGFLLFLEWFVNSEVFRIKEHLFLFICCAWDGARASLHAKPRERGLSSQGTGKGEGSRVQKEVQRLCWWVCLDSEGNTHKAQNKEKIPASIYKIPSRFRGKYDYDIFPKRVTSHCEQLWPLPICLWTDYSFLKPCIQSKTNSFKVEPRTSPCVCMSR